MHVVPMHWELRIRPQGMKGNPLRSHVLALHCTGPMHLQKHSRLLPVALALQVWPELMGEQIRPGPNPGACSARHAEEERGRGGARGQSW